MTLPKTPEIQVQIETEFTAEARATGGFLNLRRVELVANFPSGRASTRFRYDLATRAALDAVVIIAHFREANVRRAYLRSAVRPPCALRPDGTTLDANLWELPAGLIEPGELPVHAAARELEEELGFVVDEAALQPLGEWVYPSPGVMAERLMFFEVEVDPRSRKTPTEDGSPLEQEAHVVAIAIDEALRACARGELRDAKTEIGFYRLRELA